MATGLSTSLGRQAGVAGHGPFLWPRLHVDDGSGDVCSLGLSRTTWRAGRESLLSLLWDVPRGQLEKPHRGGGAQQCAELGEVMPGPPFAEELVPRGALRLAAPCRHSKAGPLGKAGL